MKITKQIKEFNITLPDWKLLTQKQIKALQTKMDDFPGPMNAELAWQLIKETLDELEKEKTK